MKIRNFDCKVHSDGRISVYYIIITRPGLYEVAITLRRKRPAPGTKVEAAGDVLSILSSFFRFFLRKKTFKLFYLI